MSPATNVGDNVPHSVVHTVPKSQSHLQDATKTNAATMAFTSDVSHSARQGKQPCRIRDEIDPLQSIAIEPSSLPSAPDYQYCGAKHFHKEVPGFCCSSGEIHLVPTEMPREHMLLYLEDSEEAAEFRRCAQSYNNMFAFTSIGMHCDKRFGMMYRGIYNFRVQGQMYLYIN